MEVINVHEEYQLFPLERYLYRVGDKAEVGKIIKKSRILSSNINIDRDIVRQLELVGIYDTAEFLVVKDDLQQYLGLDKHEFAQLVELVEVQEEVELTPKQIWKFPDNYCLVSTFSTDSSNTLAVIYQEIMISWSSRAIEGWDMIKYAFESFLISNGHPEVIGNILDKPEWLDMDEITSYIGGTDLLLDLFDQIEHLGFPVMTDSMDKAKIDVLKLQYLINKTVSVVEEIQDELGS
ncbi:MAG: hypothetical protein INQ03_07735 [Candidatus Heimdallarchaeota archaeon]|nr:hypothetical protein [Candidatus Heimdallarchaeota archaeon]